MPLIGATMWCICRFECPPCRLRLFCARPGLGSLGASATHRRFVAAPVLAERRLASACGQLGSCADHRSMRRRRLGHARPALRRRLISPLRPPGHTAGGIFPVSRPTACSDQVGLRLDVVGLACSTWARAASSCWRATDIPARRGLTSACDDDIWPPVLMDVIGTFTCSDSAQPPHPIVGLALRNRDLVILGIDLNQRRSRLTYWLSLTRSLITWPETRVLMAFRWPSICASSVPS